MAWLWEVLVLYVYFIDQSTSSSILTSTSKLRYEEVVRSLLCELI